MRSGARGCFYLLAAFLSFALTMLGAVKARAEGAQPPGPAAFLLSSQPGRFVSGLAALLPAGFEENRGQAPPGSLFMSREGGSIALFDKKGVSFIMPEDVIPKGAGPEREKAAFAPRFRFCLLRMNFGRPRRAKEVRLSGLRRLGGRCSYFIGNDPSKWRVSVPRYEKLDYEGIYPGISLIFGPAHTSLSPALGFDVVLKPGADPRRLRLFFPGAKVSTDGEGDLVVSCGPSRIRMLRPEIYQEGKSGERKIIRWRFVRIGQNGAGLKIKNKIKTAAHGRDRALVIDPTLAFSTFLGGSSIAQGQGIALDPEGGVYVTGFTLAPDFPVANPVRAFSGGVAFGDAFVTKLSLSPTPRIVYSTFLGGGADDAGYAIAVDSGGEAYIAGFTGSTNFPAVSPFQAALRGFRNVFVTKLSADGTNILYSTFFGGSSDDEGRGIALDGSNDIFITGFTDSTDFPLLKSQIPFPSGYDAFATEILASGRRLGYSVLLGGGANDKGAAIAVDASGDAYVTGQTSSPNFPLKNAYQATLRGAQNAFLVKLDPNAAILFSTFLGGSATDSAAAIALDTAGAAYIAGSTTSPDFPVITPLQPLTGGKNAFVSKFSPSGGLLYSTFLGGSGQDEAAGIAVDTMGNAYITGQASSTDFPVKNPVQGLTAAKNAFVTEINPVGDALVYSTLLGGGMDDSGLAIAVDSSGSAFVSGATNSFDFPSVHALRIFTDTTDAFVTKLAATPNLPPSPPTLVNPSNGQTGLPTSVTFTWDASTDPDGDPVTYRFFLCTNSDFNGCPPSAIAVAASGGAPLAKNSRSPFYALIFSIALLAAKRKRKRFLSLTLLVSMTAIGLFLLLASCGNGTPGPSGVVQRTVSGLASNTTYFWKVLALDGRGGSTISDIRSFKTG